MPEFLWEAQSIGQRIRALREALHRCPEPGNREVETSRMLLKEMERLGCSVKRYQTTAFSAELVGARAGKTVALRADMDALPIAERTGLSFASGRDGMMHACGHDIHMAAAVGAAWLLERHAAELHGRVRFLFQPDEEGRGGARAMIASGCLLPDVGAVYGGHVTPALPLGAIGIRYGAFYAASNPFCVTVTGKACHAAFPERGIDALACAAEMISALQNPLPLSGGIPSVLRVCRLRAGRAENVLADRAVFSGILRTFGEEAREVLKRLLHDTVRKIARSYGAQVSVSVRDGYPGVINEDVCTARAENTARSLFGNDRVVRLTEPTMTTEDFGEYLTVCPGCFVHFGVGGSAPLHSSGFAPDSESAVIGAAFFAQLVWDTLHAPLLTKN